MAGGVFAGKRRLRRLLPRDHELRLGEDFPPLGVGLPDKLRLRFRFRAGFCIGFPARILRCAVPVHRSGILRAIAGPGSPDLRIIARILPAARTRFLPGCVVPDKHGQETGCSQAHEESCAKTAHRSSPMSCRWSSEWRARRSAIPHSSDRDGPYFKVAEILDDFESELCFRDTAGFS